MWWAAGVLTLAIGQAGPEPAWFPFVIPDLAGPATDGAALDLSALSPEPAGAHGFLRPRGEDLVDDRGVPIRLFGSNFTDYHPMMPKEHAAPVARRLRQLGINFVRFHYFDWSKAPDGILNPDGQTLNPEKLDQLDWLFAQLKAHGVWVDLNLHVARGYRDMPPGWDRMGKHLDLLHEPYIQSQLQYARDLIGHRNPYTGLRYADDPAVALIELNNENSALQDWPVYATLPDVFRRPMQEQWNVWLRDRYRDLAALNRAWGATGLTGPELLRNGSLAAGVQDWTYQRSGGEGTLTIVATPDAPGGRCLRWTVTAAGTQSWHHQLQQSGLPVQSQRTYTLAFRARAATGGGRRLKPSVMMQVDPWRTVASGGELTLTDQWRSYRVTLPVGDLEGRPVRLNFECGNEPGTWELAELSLREGALSPLEPGQDPAAGTVPLPDAAASPAQALDYTRFLVAREQDYVARLRRLLREELGSRSMIVCTQASYGGAAGWLREEVAELTDQHAYPDHPREAQYEGKTVRAVRNLSMVGAVNGGLRGLASYRVAGKPFTVTEFDLNPPNDFAAECFPLLALLGAYQGWSGLLDYVWYNFGVGPGREHFSSPWATAGHSGQMAFVPAAALLFRQGLVKPAASRATLTVPREAALKAASRNRIGFGRVSWADAGVGDLAAWTTGLEVRLTDGDGPVTASREVPTADRSRLVSDTGEIVYDRTEEGRESLQVSAPACRLLAGFVAGRSFDLGDLRVQVGQALHRDYALLCLVALDGQPLDRSRQALLTVVNRVENTGMRYDEQRTLALDWGRPPVLAQFVPLTLGLPGAGWTCQALDGGGRPVRTIALDGGTLTTRPGDATMWYLLSR